MLVFMLSFTAACGGKAFVAGDELEFDGGAPQIDSAIEDSGASGHDSGLVTDKGSTDGGFEAADSSSEGGFRRSARRGRGPRCRPRGGRLRPRPGPLAVRWEYLKRCGYEHRRRCRAVLPRRLRQPRQRPGDVRVQGRRGPLGVRLREHVRLHPGDQSLRNLRLPRVHRRAWRRPVRDVRRSRGMTGPHPWIPCRSE